MGATGTTVDAVLEHYRANVSGTPTRVIALNMIITPEYIRCLRDRWPETIICAYRLDRSSPPRRS